MEFIELEKKEEGGEVSISEDWLWLEINWSSMWSISQSIYFII